jgi:hypothetical protein
MMVNKVGSVLLLGPWRDPIVASTATRANQFRASYLPDHRAFEHQRRDDPGLPERPAMKVVVR